MNKILSIITVNKDSGKDLLLTINSLIPILSWERVEYIIVDGDSSDESISIINNYKNYINKYISEPDSGIYDAMNKGILMSSGEWLWFLNSGDEFRDELSLDAAVSQMKILRADLLIGGYTVSGQSLAKQYSKRSKKINRLDFAFNRRGGCHQAMLFNRKKLLDLNGFSLEFQLASDFDVILRIIEGGKTFRTQKVLAKIEPGGISDQRIFDVIREKHQIRRIHYSKNTFILFMSIGWGLAVKTKIRGRNFFGLK